MLILVRHGRTAANAAGRLLGRLDPPLDELGERQALAVAGAVASAAVRGTDVPAPRVVTSPLRRARQTADAVAAVLGVGVEVDERWIELDYGEFDGRAIDEVGADVWAAWRGDLCFCPPGGESLAALGERVHAACEDLAGEPAAGDVIVVSHVSPIKAAVAWALGVPGGVAWRTHLDPASLTRVGIGPAGPVLRSFNERSHLPG